MALRRPHTMSRKGRRECKRRKVKCDEIHPSCFNCTRYGVSCSYGFDDSKRDRVWSPPRETTSARIPGSQSAGDQPLDHPGAESSLPRGPSVSIVNPSTSWGRDLELMHHYCTVTSATMAHQEAARHVWRVIVPQEGYAHDYLQSICTRAYKLLVIRRPPCGQQGGPVDELSYQETR